MMYFAAGAVTVAALVLAGVLLSPDPPDPPHR